VNPEEDPVVQSLLQPPVCASQHLELQSSCTFPKITGMTTRIFLGGIKAGPLKCTAPTVQCRELPGKSSFVLYCNYLTT
jgi:hypothetical protein